jgi:hypothetical protein
MPWKYYNPRKAMPDAYKDLSEWGVDIPTTDTFAYPNNLGTYDWVYNKMKICATQNLPHGPIGTTPTVFPVIIKPIYNLYGGGNSIQVAHTIEEYENIQDGGLFWSPFQMGEHYSVDIIMLHGKIQETIWFRGEKLSLGMFDYWELTKNYSSQLWCYVTDWAEFNLSNYTGCVNLEVIGDVITEVHLRMGDIDRLGSQPLMEAIHILYNAEKWPNIDLEIPDTFYIAALFAQPATQFTINERLLHEINSNLTYFQLDDSYCNDSNPPSGTRLAIFCDKDFNKVCKARNITIALFKPDIHGQYTDCLTNFVDLKT